MGGPDAGWHTAMEPVEELQPPVGANGQHWSKTAPALSNRHRVLRVAGRYCKEIPSYGSPHAGLSDQTCDYDSQGRPHQSYGCVEAAAGKVSACTVLTFDFTFTRRPFSSRRRRSHFSRVLWRWAIMNVVRPRIKISMACMIAASVPTSTALVGSSRIRMGASFRKARASDMRWPLLAAHGADGSEGVSSLRYRSIAWASSTSRPTRRRLGRCERMFGTLQDRLVKELAHVASPSGGDCRDGLRCL
jgi:hypothetical protein